MTMSPWGQFTGAEKPTSGDLKSGDCLFFTTPPPPEKLTQPPMGMT